MLTETVGNMTIDDHMNTIVSEKDENSERSGEFLRHDTDDDAGVGCIMEASALVEKDCYSIKDIRQYFRFINVTPDKVADKFQTYLTDIVKNRICELDKVVVEITPQIAINHSTTTHTSVSINFHSSYKNRNAYSGRKPTNVDHRRKNDEFDDHRGRPSKFNNHHNTEHWNSNKSFNLTKSMTKEGVEKNINDIRISLNKISNKNYETHRDIILNLIENFIEDANTIKALSEDTTLNPFINIQKIAQFMFDIASTNKFYGEIYADLYKELVEKFEIFSTILNDFVSTYNDNIHTLQYVDSNVDYDAYCEYNKMNEKRRATAAFIVLLMNRSVLPTTTLTDLILHFQSVFTRYISEENRINESDEITEVLFLLITLGKDILCKLPEWESQIVPNIIEASKLKAKEQKSMSSRAVFKYMELLKKIGL